MTLVVGTNCGLVTTAPTTDPLPGTAPVTMDTRARAIKVTTTGATTISEIGWYAEQNTEESNFEVGVYSHDSVSDQPDVLLYSDTVNAKGTTLGWKTVSSLSWNLSASTTYWIAIQLDNTTTTTTIGVEAISGEKYSYQTDTTLSDPWPTSSELADRILAIYALTGSSPDATVTPSALSLNLTQPTPSYLGGELTITPDAQTLTLSQPTPTTSGGVSTTVTPDALSITLSQLSPLVGNIGQSLSIDYGNDTITQAKITVTYSGGTPNVFLTADGTNWESVTSGVTHTFTNTGTDLRWRVVSAGTTITKIEVTDYH